MHTRSSQHQRTTTAPPATAITRSSSSAAAAAALSNNSNSSNNKPAVSTTTTITTTSIQNVTTIAVTPEERSARIQQRRIVVRRSVRFPRPNANMNSIQTAGGDDDNGDNNDNNETVDHRPSGGDNDNDNIVIEPVASAGNITNDASLEVVEAEATPMHSYNNGRNDATTADEPEQKRQRTSNSVDDTADADDACAFNNDGIKKEDTVNDSDGSNSNAFKTPEVVGSAIIAMEEQYPYQQDDDDNANHSVAHEGSMRAVEEDEEQTLLLPPSAVGSTSTATIEKLQAVFEPDNNTNTNNNPYEEEEEPLVPPLSALSTSSDSTASPPEVVHSSNSSTRASIIISIKEEPVQQDHVNHDDDNEGNDVNNDDDEDTVEPPLSLVSATIAEAAIGVAVGPIHAQTIDDAAVGMAAEVVDSAAAAAAAAAAVVEEEDPQEEEEDIRNSGTTNNGMEEVLPLLVASAAAVTNAPPAVAGLAIPATQHNSLTGSDVALSQQQQQQQQQQRMGPRIGTNRPWMGSTATTTTTTSGRIDHGFEPWRVGMAGYTAAGTEWNFSWDQSRSPVPPTNLLPWTAAVGPQMHPPHNLWQQGNLPGGAPWTVAGLVANQYLGEWRPAAPQERQTPTPYNNGQRRSNHPGQDFDTGTQASERAHIALELRPVADPHAEHVPSSEIEPASNAVPILVENEITMPADVVPDTSAEAQSIKIASSEPTAPSPDDAGPNLLLVGPDVAVVDLVEEQQEAQEVKVEVEEPKLPVVLVERTGVSLNATQLQHSVGRTRASLNKHLSELGLSSVFSMGVVSKAGMKLSHLTFNHKWNDLPNDEQTTLQWWLGQGSGRLRLASPLDPAKQEQQPIPIFWAVQQKGGGKGGSYCHYVGHFECVKFVTNDQHTVLFRKKNRQALIELKFVRFDAELAAKIAVIDPTPVLLPVAMKSIASATMTPETTPQVPQTPPHGVSAVTHNLHPVITPPVITTSSIMVEATQTAHNCALFPNNTIPPTTTLAIGHTTEKSLWAPLLQPGAANNTNQATVAPASNNATGRSLCPPLLRLGLTNKSIDQTLVTPANNNANETPVETRTPLLRLATPPHHETMRMQARGLLHMPVAI